MVRSRTGLFRGFEHPTLNWEYRVRGDIPLQFSRPMLFLACGVSLAAADYTTYIGDEFPYTVTALAVDAAGNTYVTGSRAVNMPALGTGATLADIFVSKLDRSGNLTLLATLSGKASDKANSIALDPSGNIYLAGSTTSVNFPLHQPLQSVPAPQSFPPLGTGFLVEAYFTQRISAARTDRVP
jgi:Beta-propeller repeat